MTMYESTAFEHYVSLQGSRIEKTISLNGSALNIKNIIRYLAKHIQKSCQIRQHLQIIRYKKEKNNFFYLKLFLSVFFILSK